MNYTVVINLLALMAAAQVPAATYEVFPSVNSSCSEPFEQIANQLKPGDELIVHDGVYSQSCRRLVTVNGTASQPIIIRAADGARPLLTRPRDNIDTQNNVEIVNSSYLVVRGLRFRGGNTGVRFIGGHHITIEDCEIFETGNNAIAMNSGNADSFVIRRNHIHHTGLATSGPTEGEGMYIGCHDARCRTTNSLIEGNYIHHLRGTSDGGNDGIEIKPGSYGNVIRDNVIHDTNIGKQFPCIFVYGGGAGINIVEGNAIWNCGEGIQVVSDAIIRNNVVFNSSITGITAAPHTAVPHVRNVSIVNNTIVGHPTCVRLQWDQARDATFANNAVYCPGSTAFDGSGVERHTVSIRANYVEGRLLGATVDQARFFAGGALSAAFVDAGQLDFRPAANSSLVAKADPKFAPKGDFNAKSRTARPDVGAYETAGLDTNRGWKISSGFKDQSPTNKPL